MIIHFPYIMIAHEFGEVFPPRGKWKEPLQKCPNERVLVGWVIEMLVKLHEWKSNWVRIQKRKRPKVPQMIMGKGCSWIRMDIEKVEEQLVELFENWLRVVGFSKTRKILMNIIQGEGFDILRCFVIEEFH
ncbi:hypothetical protein ACOSQ4_009454 [Xanthoceras sorbifolium]